MRLHSILLSTLLGLLAVLLTGCGGAGSDGIRITQGQQTREDRGSVAPALAVGTAQVVHVDRFERIATIRRGRNLGDGFLIATDRSGEETAVLRGLPRSSRERLQTAEIIEGLPDINDAVHPASATRNAALAQIYRDPAGDND